MARPGHYISMPPDATQADMLIPLMKPGVAGLQIRITWRALEVGFGQYDFGKIASYVALARRFGRDVILMIEDKTFEAGGDPLPAYLQDFSLENNRGGRTANRWHPYVNQRLRILTGALRAYVDGLGGIALQESSLSLATNVLARAEYSPERYAQALIDRSRFCDFLYLNFIRGDSDLTLIKRVVNSSEAAVGGPDLLPNSDSLTKRFYPALRETANSQDLFIAAQYDSYAHPKAGTDRFWTLVELYWWARRELRVKYLFWNVKWWDTPAGSHKIDDAFDVIATHPEI